MPRSTRALILVAAELEAEILFGTDPELLERLGARVVGVGSAGDAGAEAAVAATTADLVINPGFAGGLTAAASPGRSYRVSRWVPQPTLSDRGASAADIPDDLLAALEPLDLLPGLAVTVQAPVGDPAARAKLAATGADLVEMEGARWAAMAACRSLPYLSIRVISDRADNALPRPRHELLDARGRVRWLRWVAAAARAEQPWSAAYRSLRSAQRDWRNAVRALAAVGAALGRWQQGR